MQDFKKYLPYLRHSTGGKIFDSSEVCELSIFDRDSSAAMESSVWLSEVRNSRITASNITGARIENSTIDGADVHGGLIVNSFVSAELVSGEAYIKDSQVFGYSRICHNATINQVKISNLTVKGTAVLHCWKQDVDEVFDGLRGYVSRGVWTRPPRVLRINGITLTESIEDKGEKFAFVMCKEYPINRWLKGSRRYAKTQQWTDEQIQAVRAILTEWLDNPLPL